MTDLDALLAGIVANPHEHLRWLIVADWLDDHGFADRAELLRLHRMLIDTCCEPDAHPERAAWQARIVELIDQGVTPCVPQHTLMLPGGVPLVGNFIPPGEFLMGSEETEDEKPVHKVTLTKGFFLGIYPVMQDQWRAVMDTDPSSFKGSKRPVESVSWDDADEFCARRSFLAKEAVRLPTEAEWEYACRAGTTTHYHYGDVPSADRMNYDGSRVWNGSQAGLDREATTDVGSFPVNPWGLSDTHGNAGEWCSDWYDLGFYERSPAEDPECQDGEMRYRVLRGGTCIEHPRCASSAYRSQNGPDRRLSASGFRVAFTLS